MYTTNVSFSRQKNRFAILWLPAARRLSKQKRRTRKYASAPPLSFPVCFKPLQLNNCCKFCLVIMSEEEEVVS
ncbi:GTP cyclohydrolase [Trichinella pseudospiralis]